MAIIHIPICINNFFLFRASLKKNKGNLKMKLTKPYAAAICAASATSRPRPPLYTSVITNGFLYDLIILTLVQKSTSIKNIMGK